MRLKVLTLLLGILFSVLCTAGELAGGGAAETIREAQAFQRNSVCTPQERKKNIETLAKCDASWEEWGIDPKPAPDELLDPNHCPDLVSLGALQGCGDALIALPVMLGEVAARALLSTLPEDKNTFEYVSQNGSLAEIHAHLGNDFLRDKCGIGPQDEALYISQKCPTTSEPTNPHIDSAGTRACRQSALAEINASKACVRSSDTRALYRAEASKIREQATEIKRIQDERKAKEAQFNREIIGLKSSCDYYLNTLIGTRSRAQEFNDCIARNTRGKRELREALMKNSHGWISQLGSSFASTGCYNERIQKKLMCEIAPIIMTGGGALTLFAANRLGRGAQVIVNSRVAQNFRRDVALNRRALPADGMVGANNESLMYRAMVDSVYKDERREVDVNMTVDIADPGSAPNVVNMNTFFNFRRTTEIPRRRRNFFKSLRGATRADTPRSREMAAFIVEFDDGTSRAIRYTSNSRSMVSGEDFDKALAGSGVTASQSARITKISHIHTHPWTGSDGIGTFTPSPQDVNYYNAQIRTYDIDLLNRVAGDRSIDFEAYILPTCEVCDDVFIHLTKEQIQRSRVRSVNN